MKLERYWEWESKITKAQTVAELDKIVKAMKKNAPPPDDDCELLELLRAAAYRRVLLT